MFRNVGILQSGAGEIPKRIHTRFKTGRKFEIKKINFILRKITEPAYKIGQKDRTIAGRADDLGVVLWVLCCGCCALGVVLSNSALSNRLQL